MTSLARRIFGRAELCVPIGYALITLAFSRPLRAFEHGPDEGFNLAKAALVADGHRLYTEIWSDQPPLFTWLLRAVFGVFGEDVLVGRLLVLALACLLLAAAARTARLAFGAGGAWAAPLLLLLVPQFQPSSVAVWIGLPALSFATLAFAAAAQAHRRGSAPWALGSGALLALGAFTKLFVLPLVPVLLLLTGLGPPPGRRRRCALAWLAGFAGVSLAVGLTCVGPTGWDQLVGTHLEAARSPAFDDAPESTLLARLRPSAWVGALALAGAVLACRRRPAAIPLALAGWMAAALGVLAVHRPVRDHHMLLWTVPAALLAAPVLVAAVALARRAVARAPGRRLVRVATVSATVVAVVWLLSDAGGWRVRRYTSASERLPRELVERVRSLARAGDEMLTDRPMIAFRAGVPVLPESAVVSLKRFLSERITEARLMELAASRRTAFVLIGRFHLPALRRRLAAGYQIVHRNGAGTLFLRAGSREEPWPCAWPDCLQQSDDWYRGSQARELAEIVLLAQRPDGGWAKLADRSRGTDRGDAGDCVPTHLLGCSSIDERATTAELRFLARAYTVTADERLATAFRRGLDHLLASQTPSGGWAQVPTAPAGAHQAAITLNDNAMAHVMSLLDDVARRPEHAFVGAERVEQARRAFERGVACLLACQVRVDGTPSVWCAQHDRLTLAPVAGRSFEPASLSGRESVGVVRLLLRVADPSPEVRSAVEAAAAWFEASRLPAADGGPPRWARFYDLSTSRPIFPDLDGVVHATFEALSAERRQGYDYITDEPRALLEEDVPRWRAGLASGR